jgi:hypothetical protein
VQVGVGLVIGISGGEESYSSGKRETELLQHLLTEFGTITFRVDRDDIVWMHDPCNCYYVKSAYKVLTEEGNQVVQTFKTKVWHKHVL